MSLPNIGLEPLVPHALLLPAPQAVPLVEVALPAVEVVLLAEEAALPVVEVVDPSVEEAALPVVEVVDPSASGWQLQPQLEGMEVSKATCPPSSKVTGPRVTSS
jgi:hypothetical protein